MNRTIVTVALSLLTITASLVGGCTSARVSIADWGSTDGKAVQLYTLENASGLSMKVTNYGAIITELHVPDRNGVFDDIVLGYDHLNDYLAGSPYFGAIAGRDANRIDQGRFTLDGVEYQLARNNGPHHLHGGYKGFDKLVWSGEVVKTNAGPAVKLAIVSPDGDENYPGELTAVVTYTLGNDDTLRVDMQATTTAPTLCDLAQHTYWNLAGHDSGSIHEHLLTLYADGYTPVDGTLIPTGEVKPVAGTPFDFRSPKPIGRDLAFVGGDPIGYDHNFVVNGNPRSLRPVARLVDPESGRVMTLEADQPGVQFYSGNFLDGTNIGKGGYAYRKYGAVVLETQTFPDAINQDGWVKPILRPGDTYRHAMIYRFTSD